MEGAVASEAHLRSKRRSPRRGPSFSQALKSIGAWGGAGMNSANTVCGANVSDRLGSHGDRRWWIANAGGHARLGRPTGALREMCQPQAIPLEELARIVREATASRVALAREHQSCALVLLIASRGTNGWLGSALNSSQGWTQCRAAYLSKRDDP